MSTARLKHFFLKLAIVALAAGVLAPLAAQAQIAFRGAASSSTSLPAFRAAASGSSGITFVGAGSQVARETSGSITPAIPSNTVANDFAILIIAGRPTDTTEPATPSGWTHRSTHLREVGANDLRITTYFRVLSGGDANPSITLPASWVGTAAGMTGQIAVWRGVLTTAPRFDVPDVENDAAAAATWVPPAITTVTNGALVVSAVATSDDNALNLSSAQGFTLRMSGGSYDTTLGGDHAVGLAEKIQSVAGAVTMPTWNQSANASDLWSGITFALRPAAATSITIDNPAGTNQDDMMIASVAVTPSTTTITPPSGWTLVRRTDNGSATTNSLATYRKTAGASEPTTYTWTLGGATAAVGGIRTFENVDTANPIDVENGQTTASGTAHATPDVTTTVANAMVVTSHSFASSATWSTPSGMTEEFDIASETPTVSSGISIMGAWARQVAAGATGAKSSTASGQADRGNAHILALRSATGPLTINKPAGTVAEDVMVAAIAGDHHTMVITPPTGWTLVRRVENTDAALGLEVYYRVAGASEPASYIWLTTASSDNFKFVVGGIQSFSGVDTGSPIDIDAGQCTPQPPPCGSSSLTHATPDVTTTVANTMLVTAHAFESSNTWTPPAGMTEAYDQAVHATPTANGMAIEGNYQLQAAAGATGAKTATAAGGSDDGLTHILALRPPVPGDFNAYETSTASGAITGVITTKRAGATISVDIISVNAARTAIQTTFTGAVRVELLNASDNSGAINSVTACRPTWTVIQTLTTSLTFAAGDNGRKTLSFTEANSYPNARLRITYPTTSPTLTGCSMDNFAIRPDTFASYSATDNDWETAGTTRTLSNTTVPGGTVHKAGRPFTVQATAVNAAGTPATTTNYTGTPTATLTDCGASSACPSTFGTMTLGASFVAGVLTASTASYNDVGSFSMELRDTTFSNVDATDGSPADCSATGRYVCSSTLAVGRFVPDNFAVALNTPDFGTACGSFTYVGQKFNYATAPVITVTARNFAGGTTTNYAGALWQITTASLTGKSYTTAAGTLDVSGLPGTDPVIAPAGSGTGTLTFGSGTGLFFPRTTPVAPFDAEISLAINVIDADGVSYATNPARFGQATAGNGIAFSAGKPMRFGRFALRNANGSQLLPLLVPVEAQYWSGPPANAFITNTLDSCSVIAPANYAMSSYTGNLSGSPTCETAISGGGTLSAGRGTLILATPGAGNDGSVTLTPNLGATASGSTCTSLGGAPGSATAANPNLPHLQGNWSGGAYDANPSGRATFGVFRGAEEVIHVRENF